MAVGALGGLERTVEVVFHPGDVLTFDGSKSYDPDGQVVEWRWDFGDGFTERTSTPTTTHAYKAPGVYNASLVVVDNDGNVSKPYVRPITIAKPLVAPTALFTIR